MFHWFLLFFMSVTWKSFPFFDKTQLESINDFKAQTTCITNGIFIGDMDGNLYHVDRSIKCTWLLKAYPKRITQLLYLKKRSILLSIGEDSAGVPTLKVWTVEAVKSTPPTLIKSIRITYGNKIFPVTAFAVLENMTQVAVGLENGIVILIRGDISRDKGTKSKVLHEGSEIVTGLGFREQDGGTFLYIVTQQKIFTCMTSTKEGCLLLDNMGADSKNSIIGPQEREQEMVLATKGAVYFYGPDGKGPCFLIEGQKSEIQWYKGYLMIVSYDFHDANTLGDDGITGNGTLLSIYDLKGKYVAFRDDFGKRIFNRTASKAIGEPIKHIICEWGDIIVFTSENNVFHLREKDLQARLDILNEKNYFTLSLNLVLQPTTDSNNVSKSRNIEDLIQFCLKNTEDPARLTVMDICKRNGDYLYSKGEFNASMKQYMRTIGHLQPSFVIRKFLDAQRIHNLTAYLKELHDQQLANPNHTTLLLNCYTKLKDLVHLNEFIDKSIAFDVDTAIIVCRQSGYYQQALRIALKFTQHDWYIKIQIEDLQLHDDAISYLASLNEQLFQKTLVKYGHSLVMKRPERMTSLLLQHIKDDDIISFKDMVPFYVNQPEWQSKFLEGILKLKFGIEIESEQLKVETPNDPSFQLLCDLLLDIQLSLYSANVSNIIWKNKLLKFLNSQNVQYDLENALVLCKQHEFDEGVLILYEKLELYDDCLSHHMRNQDLTNILATCHKFGDKQPGLWTRAFEFCAQSDLGMDVNAETSPKLIQILDELEKRKLLSLVEIIQLLSKNP
ncbi:hypothetical protein BC833DRAFT_571048, partial [Globomyces pollinis-pini]